MESDDPLFLPWFDTDGDGVVTEADLSAVGYNFGDTVVSFFRTRSMNSG